MSDMREEAEDEISLLDLAITIKENIKLLVLAPLVAGVVALGGSFLIAPTFTASTSFLQPQQQQGAAAAMLQGLGALGGLAGAASGLKNPADQYVAFIKSRSVPQTRWNIAINGSTSGATARTTIICGFGQVAPACTS